MAGDGEGVWRETVPERFTRNIDVTSKQQQLSDIGMTRMQASRYEPGSRSRTALSLE